MVKPLLKYRCKKCGTESLHKELSVLQVPCKTCNRKTTVRLVSGPALPTRSPAPTVIPQVGVKYTPTIRPLKPEPQVGQAKTPTLASRKEEAATQTTTEGGTPPDPETWADIYATPFEVTALALKMPRELIPDCTIQGARISRFCEKHNLELPEWLDAVPIASRAISDIAKFALGASAAWKDLKTAKAAKGAAKVTKAAEGVPTEGAPEGVSIPESTVEHVSVEAAQIISDEELVARLNRSKKSATGERTGPTKPLMEATP